MLNFVRILIILLSSFYSYTAFSWDHSIELGYGYSVDPNHTDDHNSGFLLTGDLQPLKHTPYTYWSLNGAAGQWHSTASHHRNLTTAALSLALRYYPFTVNRESPAYFLGSVGPAFLSSNEFGDNIQAANVTFQWNVGLGMEFLKKWDINLRWSHFSNAYIARPDEGFTVRYLLSIGYLF